MTLQTAPGQGSASCSLFLLGHQAEPRGWAEGRREPTSQQHCRHSRALCAKRAEKYEGKQGERQLWLTAPSCHATGPTQEPALYLCPLTGKNCPTDSHAIWKQHTSANQRALKAQQGSGSHSPGQSMLPPGHLQACPCFSCPKRRHTYCRQRKISVLQQQHRRLWCWGLSLSHQSHAGSCKLAVEGFQSTLEAYEAVDAHGARFVLLHGNAQAAGWPTQWPFTFLISPS